MVGRRVCFQACLTHRDKSASIGLTARRQRKKPRGTFDRFSNQLPAPRDLTVWFRRSNISSTGQENDLFRRETQACEVHHIERQRNSGPGGSRCSCCGSSVRSCCGLPSGNSPRRCSNCRREARGSSPYGSFTSVGCNTDWRNRQLLAPAALENAVKATRRCCKFDSLISPSRSARSRTRTRHRQRRLLRRFNST